MKRKYINSFLLILVFIVFLIGIQSAFGQQQFANVITSESDVDNSGRAIDGSLLSSAVVNANSGLLLGLGSYSGHIELAFPNEIPANQTSYIRLDTEDDLLPFLLGGNLGGLLADVAGLVILGNQEFSVDVKNNNTSILQADSGIANSFAANAVRVVSNSDGDYFMAVTPNAAYNRINLENRVGSLVGLNTQKELNVFGAFTADNANTCLNVDYTSFDGSGITLDLLELSGAGVTNPEFAIDDDINTFSELGFGIVSVAANMSQTFYLDTPSDSDDVFYFTMGVDPSLLQLGVLNNIQVLADNGTNANVFSDNINNLLDLDLLGLLTDNGTVTIPVEPGVSIDRISIDLSSLLGVSLDQKIRIYDVFSAPKSPEIDPDSENITICESSSVSLIATTNNPATEELLWYDAEIGGNLLAVLASGESFDTPVLTTSTSYYVSAREIGCTDESPRVEVLVNVSPIPTATDIDIEKENNDLCASGEVTYVPSSDISGDFTWYFDADGVNEITDNVNVNDVVYNIDANGELTISGLQADVTPYSIYAKLTTTDGQCANEAGDFAVLNITGDDLNVEANIVVDTIISLSELLNLSNSSSATVNSEEISICAGTSIDLLTTIENETGLELRFYDALIGGNLLANVNSGIPFNTGILDETTDFYIGVALPGCSQESIRATITVNVLDIPTAADIEVSGADEPVCSSNDVVLVPTSDIDGTYEWFFDIDATNQILDNMVVGDVTYTISDTGTLTISGLDEGSSPYDYFVRLQQGVVDCTNANGDLKEVNVTIIDSNFNIDATLDTVITVEDVVDVNNDNSSISLTGSVTGDVSEGDTVTLRLNGTDYTGTLDSNLDYDIDVAGLDALIDTDNTVELSMNSGLCSVTKQLPFTIPELPTGDLTQVFCASDNPTILDLQLGLEDGVLFDALVGGSLLGSDTPLVDGGVYFTGLLNLPIDVFARIAITVEVVNVDAPTSSQETQTFCESTSPVIGDLEVNQNEVVFYDSAEGGNMLNPTDVLVAGNYYVSRVENGCESAERLQIIAVIEEDEPITLTGQTEEACISSESYSYFTQSGETNYEWKVVGGVITDGGTSTDDYVTVVWNELQNTSIQVAYLSTDTCSPNKELLTEIETMRCGEVLGAEFCLEVYNEFSPNSDGFNDFFEVECITDYANTVRIYNRNGNLVFETQDYQNNWDGIANVGGVLNKGDHLPAGTYYYAINIPELNRDLVGWLHLAR
ncbi:gliding motility-associated C-terminal domain-containing protein [Maribacter sp. Asnod1-A12]|uniref:Ig-like domain-containing protein n=1 Tax=Maribacter sp. Asnod1-A12 TaxID=3160576 RepID=UPI00386C7EF4